MSGVKQAVLRTQTHTANFVGMMLRFRFAPVGQVPFAVGAPLGELLEHIFPFGPPRSLRNMSPSTGYGYVLEICFINALLSLN